MIQAVLAGGAIAATAAMAFSDIKTRTIPDAMVVSVAVLALLNCLAARNIEFLGYREAIIVFAAGALLFKFGLMGGGDVKMMSACALWMPARLLDFCLITALAGGVLALGALIIRSATGRPILQIPYGVAIALGAAPPLLHKMAPLLLLNGA